MTTEPKTAETDLLSRLATHRRMRTAHGATLAELSLLEEMQGALARAQQREGELREAARELVALDERHIRWLKEGEGTDEEFEQFAAEFDAAYGKLAILAAAEAGEGG